MAIWMISFITQPVLLKIPKKDTTEPYVLSAMTRANHYHYSAALFAPKCVYSKYPAGTPIVFYPVLHYNGNAMVGRGCIT